MSSTITLPPEHETGTDTAQHLPGGAPHRGGRGTPFPEPQVEKMRGLRLIALWVALTAGAWMVLGGAGYGFYLLVHSFLL